MAHAVIAVAARHGDAQLYNQFKEQMQKASSPEQYYGYFYALSQFPQPDLTKETLDSILTPAVRGQDLYIRDSSSASSDKPGHDVELHADAL